MTRTFWSFFVTAFDYYAVEAFRFSAIDYLLKPISSNNLEEALHKAVRNIGNKRSSSRFELLFENYYSKERHKKKIVLKEAETQHVLAVDDIICCSAEGSYTLFYLRGDKKVMVSKHLKEYEKLLENYDFIRVHRSHLINLHKIVKYEKKEGGVLFMEDDIQVVVSVRKREKVSALLKEF